MGLIARIKDRLFDRRNVIEIESLEVDGNTVSPDELINKKLYYHKIIFTFVPEAQTQYLRLNVLTNIKDKFDSFAKMSFVFSSVFNGVPIIDDNDKIIFGTVCQISPNYIPQTVFNRHSFIGNNGIQFSLQALSSGYQIRLFNEDTINLSTGKMNTRASTSRSLTLVSEEVKEIIL